MQFLSLEISKRSFGIVLFFILLTACKPKTIVLKSPPGYDFQTAVSKRLEVKLREISGIAWDKKKNQLIAEDDESGNVYMLDRSAQVIGQYPFGEKGDYEDVALIDTIPYVLRSDGTIFKINNNLSNGFSSIELGKLELPGDNDFESLYYDPGRKALVMLCKNCDIDKGTKVSAFAYYIDSIGFDQKPVYQIDLEAIRKLAPRKASRFQPSAATIHPRQQKLYILSALSRQLVIADLDGNPEGVYVLAPKLFPQPEGICFQKDGEMYISNEGGTGRATLLYFRPLEIGGEEKGKQEGKYDLSKPDDKMELRKHLHEISGMAWIKEKNMILAENDEKGDIYQVDFKNKKDDFKKIKFGGKGDYEDIVHTDAADYLLVSSGTIVQVVIKDEEVVDTKEFTLKKKGNNEFESLYFDEAENALIMLCKQCSHEKDESRSAFRFDLAKLEFEKDPVYTIDINAIKKILDDDKAEFKPSAASIHPITGKLFVVSSVGKLLVVADKKGNVEQVFRLDPKLFNQPEGITFSPNGDLYISNEGGDGAATILKFIYKP